MVLIKVGTCGWGYLNPSYFFPDWKTRFKDKLQVYAAIFNVGEVNYTFYHLPDENVMKLWRQRVDEVNKDFEFTLKAPKVITHLDKFQSDTSIREFEKTKRLAKALRCKLIIFQTSSSFKPTSNNLKAISSFFDNIDREDFLLAWEFRGKEWFQKSVKEKVISILQKYEVLHVVDFFLDLPLYSPNGVYYTRLHGSPPGKRQYYYKFTQRDLSELKSKITSLIQEREVKELYVMFNNVSMYEDAYNFREMLKKEGFNVI
jgi:uncharacterized protein YecE (DUF72 family)